MLLHPIHHKPPAMLFAWSTGLGSLLAILLTVRYVLIQFAPPGLLSSWLRRAISWRREVSIVIDEFDEFDSHSDTFDATLRYLNNKFSSSAAIVKATDSVTPPGYSFIVDTSHVQTLHDELEGIEVRWSIRAKDSGVRVIELSFDRGLNDIIRESYFPPMLEANQRERKLYTNGISGEKGSLWSSVPFSHPSTFSSLAIDPVLKSKLMRDLVSFQEKKRAGNRGYLLCGPPGTGKTSLAAAMANFLEFDVYDLELSAVASNTQLRRLLAGTRRKSAIVIEDIDRHDGEPSQSHLSSEILLNFMDGLWPCCGQERIVVVTATNKERVHPAMLRPGRLGVHVDLSYCGVEALRTLVSSYFFSDVYHDGRMVEWAEVEELLSKVQVTPAAMAEVFMRSEGPDMARSEITRMLAKELEASNNG